MCDWELSLACQLDPSASGKLVPVLIEPDAEAHVPYKVSLHQWLSTDRPDWFERLATSVELTIEKSPPTLSFRTGPADTIVNHTLPEVEVVVLQGAERSLVPSAEPITIRAEGGDLQGTLTVEAEAGVATFADLSLAAAAPEVRLVVEAPGCTPAASEPFAVEEPPPRPASRSRDERGPDEPLRIATLGSTLVFFADGESLAVLGPQKLEVFREGVRVGGTEFTGRVRLTARSGDYLAFADWSGRVLLAHSDGRIRSARLGADDRVLTIPGGLCFAGDEAFVGLWNGEVWSLSLDGREPEKRFEHPPGVQVLEAAGNRWLIAGLDGTLTVVDANATTHHRLEPALLALQAWPDCVVAIGERAAYRLGLDSGRLVREALPVTRVVEAIADAELAVVMDSDGKGVRFDRQLALRGAFHTTRGARPVVADRAGRSVVFAYPDGSYAVMVDERVVFSTTSGAVAISPDGSRVALAEGDAVVISPAGALFAAPGEGRAA